MRAVLGDIVERAPTGRPEPTARPTDARDPIAPANRPARWAFAAAGLVAAAGVLGVVVVRNDEADQGHGEAAATQSPVAAPAPAPNGTAASDPSTLAPPPAATRLEVTIVPFGVPMPNQAQSPCGPAPIPTDAADVQAGAADIDGDLVDDSITLYRRGEAWHIRATSSVKGWASDTTVTLDVHEQLELSFENIDYALGAETPPPLAVMVTGSGANDRGVLANFTFLTNTPEYCIEQWTYTPPNRPTEPFQWVARRDGRFVTGMICEGAAGSRYYSLVDSTRNDDGSWAVITRLLTHDFTTAAIQFQPEQTVADSPGFVDQYGNIVGCDHPPV